MSTPSLFQAGGIWETFLILWTLYTRSPGLQSEFLQNTVNQYYCENSVNYLCKLS